MKRAGNCGLLHRCTVARSHDVRVGPNCAFQQLACSRTRPCVSVVQPLRAFNGTEAR